MVTDLLNTPPQCENTFYSSLETLLLQVHEYITLEIEKHISLYYIWSDTLVSLIFSILKCLLNSMFPNGLVNISAT